MTDVSIQQTNTQAPRLTPEQFYNLATHYASCGFPVLPLCGKEPYAQGEYWREKNGRRYQTGPASTEATLDPALIAKWAQQYPGANIGIAIPDGKVVIDIDPRNGGDATWQRICSAVNMTPTYCVQTGGGGWHVFYDVPSGAVLPSFADFGPGVDVKQLGGYVVAAGSTHPETGRQYVENNASFAPLPAELVPRLRARGEMRSGVTADIDEHRRANAAFEVAPEKAVQDIAPQAISEAVATFAPIAVQGQRYTALVKIGGMLARLGWSEASVRAFAREFIGAYGGDNVEHGVQGCVNGMSYPSGYHALLDMVPPAHRAWFGQQLDTRIANPYGVALREGRAELRAQLDVGWQATPEALAQLRRTIESDDGPNPLDACLDDDSEPAPMRRIVGGLDIADGLTVGIAGEPHAGKTPLALSLSLSIASGKPWLGRPIEQRPVIYLGFEKEHDLKSKRSRVARGLGVDAKCVDLYHVPRVGLLTARENNPIPDIARLVARAHRQTGKVPVIVVDTYSNAISAGDVDFDKPVFKDALVTLQNAVRAAVKDTPLVVLLHNKKSSDRTKPPALNDVAGSGQIIGVCDAMISVYQPDASDKTIVEIVQTRSKAEHLPPIRAQWVGNAEQPLQLSEISQNDAAGANHQPARRLSKEARQDQALNRLQVLFRTEATLLKSDSDKWHTIADLQRLMGPGYQGNSGARHAAEWAASRMVKDGELVERKNGGKRWYRPATPEEQLQDHQSNQFAAEASRRAAAMATSNVTLVPQHGGYGVPLAVPGFQTPTGILPGSPYTPQIHNIAQPPNATLPNY